MGSRLGGVDGVSEGMDEEGCEVGAIEGRVNVGEDVGEQEAIVRPGEGVLVMIGTRDCCR